MLRWLLAPKLLLAHVVVLTAVVVLVNLGFWQLRRLDEARSFNERLEQRQAAPVLSASELAGADPDDLAFRRAQVTGTYVTEHELLHLARGYRGRSGNHVLTPLVTSDGLVILVDRGWVPAALDTPPVTEAAPPTGPVTVTGQLLESQPYTGVGARDRAEGELARVLRVNLPRIEAQLPPELTPLYPLYLQQRNQEPAVADELPLAAEVPELDDGPHLSYAVQWFLFAATALAVYAAFLRKRLRERSPSAA
ncbi:MAG TPA: SURF1 family protein [Nitriliruptorales bacterium]